MVLLSFSSRLRNMSRHRLGKGGRRILLCKLGPAPIANISSRASSGLCHNASRTRRSCSRRYGVRHRQVATELS